MDRCGKIDGRSIEEECEVRSSAARISKQQRGSIEENVRGFESKPMKGSAAACRWMETK